QAFVIAVCIDALNDADRFFHCASQGYFELRHVRAAAGAEFAVAIAWGWIVSERGGDPLPDVARQMENEVAGRVFVFAGACPELSFSQFVEADFDAIQQLA